LVENQGIHKMSNERERLYCLKGRISMVGDDEVCQISFCVPWFDRGELVYFNISFNIEEFMLNDTRQFIEILNLKVKNLKENWKDYVQEHDKEGNAS